MNAAATPYQDLVEFAEGGGVWKRRWKTPRKNYDPV